jgi:hypothetical protein
MGWWGKLKKFGHKVWGGIKHAAHKIKKFWHKHKRKIKKVWHGVKKGLRFAADRGVPFTGAIAGGMDRFERLARRAKGTYNRFRQQTGMGGGGRTQFSKAAASSRKRKKRKWRGPPGRPATAAEISQFRSPKRSMLSHARKFHESKDLIRHSKRYKKLQTKVGIMPKLPYKAATHPKTRKRGADINFGGISQRSVKRRFRGPVGYPVGY